MAINFNNTVYGPGFLGTDDGPASASFRIDDTSTFSVSVTGTVTGPGSTVVLTYGADAPVGYAGTSVTLTASQYDNPTMIEFTSTAIPPGNTTAQTYRYVLSNTQVFGSDTPTLRTRFIADATDTTLSDYQPLCFASGTCIRVIRDGVEADVLVEDLKVGDHAMTASGRVRPITWIGCRTIDFRRHSRPSDVMPIRIAAHAFGNNLPMRDLFLSPGHPVLVGADADGEGGRLVPIMCLINGITIERDKVDAVTYWHVELDEHDVLLAEGLAAESYIDLGSRPWFEGADGALYDPDLVLPGMPGRCRPVAVDGPIVEAERRRHDAVAATRLVSACDWPSFEDAFAF